MISFFDNKADAVQFASDLKQTFPESSPLITTIKPERYAVSYAPRAIEELSDDCKEKQAQDFFSTQVNI
jgi:hypothetical protein